MKKLVDGNLALIGLLILVLWFIATSDKAGEELAFGARTGPFPNQSYSVEPADQPISRTPVGDLSHVKSSTSAGPGPTGALPFGEVQGILSDDELGGAGFAELVIVDKPVAVHRVGRTIGSFFPDHEGNFSTRLPVGDYSLFATRLESDTPSETDFQVGGVGKGYTFLRNFQVFEGETTFLAVNLKAGGVMEGQIIDSDAPSRTLFRLFLIRETDGLVVANTVVAGDPRFGESATSPEEENFLHGYFAIPRLEPGPYRLEVTLITGDVPEGHLPWTHSVVVPSGGIDVGALKFSRSQHFGLDPIPRRSASAGKRVKGGAVSGRIWKTRINRLPGESEEDFQRRSKEFMLNQLHEEK